MSKLPISTKNAIMKHLNLVVSDGIDKDVFSKLHQNSSLQLHPESKLSREQLIKILPTTDVLVVRSATTVDKSLLEHANQLKLVIRAGEGTDNIDKECCRERGIIVGNTPGANGPSAAEHAIALMFTLLRKTHLAHASMKDGLWEKSKFSGLELGQKTIGIVGIGRIGQQVAKKLSGFDPKILFFDPFPPNGLPSHWEQKHSIDELFAESDIVTVHVPLIEATKKLIGQKQFNLMKDNALFINAARGGIVIEDDLISALEKKRPLMAALDVFEKEPLEKTSKLREIDNLLVTPHLGASTAEAQKRVGELVVNEINKFLSEGNIQFQVN